MSIKKKSINKYLIQTTLLIGTLLLCIFKNYIWVTFSTGPRNIILRKFNFLSPTVFGYGVFFPILVVCITLILLLLSILQLFKVIKSDKKKTKLLLNVMNISFLCIPIVIGMQKFNIGIVYMLLLLGGNLVLDYYY